MTALSPTPTPLDRRVLDALPVEPPGVRAGVVVRRVYPREYGSPEGMAKLRAKRLAEVRRILRGFEHLGQVTGRGGWWRRVGPQTLPNPANSTEAT